MSNCDRIDCFLNGGCNHEEYTAPIERATFDNGSTQINNHGDFYYNTPTNDAGVWSTNLNITEEALPLIIIGIVFVVIILVVLKVI